MNFNPVTGSVTFLDILGWKGIWQRDLEAISKLHRLVTMSNDDISRHIRGRSGIKNLVVTSISDTIIILAEGEPNTTLEIHGEITKKIICEGLKIGLPVRGATAYGEFYYDKKTTIMGPAVDESASWHESVNWVGCIQTPSASIKYLQNSSTWISCQKIPYKSSEFRYSDSLALNWVDYWRNTHRSNLFNFRETIANFSPLLPEVSKYYMNAVDFYWSIIEADNISRNILSNVWSIIETKTQFKIEPIPEVVDEQEKIVGPTANNEWIVESQDENEGIQVRNVSSEQKVTIPLSEVTHIEDNVITIRTSIQLKIPVGVVPL